MSRLVDSTGLEHWFTKDGLYDGWGRDLSQSNVSAEEVQLIIEDTERRRDIDDPGIPN